MVSSILSFGFLFSHITYTFSIYNVFICTEYIEIEYIELYEGLLKRQGMNYLLANLSILHYKGNSLLTIA